MQFDLLTKDDLIEISRKLNTNEYSLDYFQKLYDFSREEIEQIKNINDSLERRANAEVN